MSAARQNWEWAWRSRRSWHNIPDVILRHGLWVVGGASAWMAAGIAHRNRAKKDELHIVGVTPRERLAYFKKHRLIPTAYPKNKL